MKQPGEAIMWKQKFQRELNKHYDVDLCFLDAVFFFSPGARFSKLPVITGPVKLFCFPLRMGVSKVLKMVQ